MLQELHESVTEAYHAGIVDLNVMQKYDKLCMIETHDMKPEEIQYIRKKIVKVTQPEFAKLLCISPSTVAKWEVGDKKPTRTALKLLSLIERKGIEFYLNTFAI